MYRSLREHLEPFCTDVHCSHGCNLFHESTPSISASSGFSSRRISDGSNPLPLNSSKLSAADDDNSAAQISKFSRRDKENDVEEGINRSSRDSQRDKIAEQGVNKSSGISRNHKDAGGISRSSRDVVNVSEMANGHVSRRPRERREDKAASGKATHSPHGKFNGRKEATRGTTFTKHSCVPQSPSFTETRPRRQKPPYGGITIKPQKRKQSTTEGASKALAKEENVNEGKREDTESTGLAVTDSPVPCDAHRDDAATFNHASSLHPEVDPFRKTSFLAALLDSDEEGFSGEPPSYIDAEDSLDYLLKATKANHHTNPVLHSGDMFDHLSLDFSDIDFSANSTIGMHAADEERSHVVPRLKDGEFLGSL